jgi:hypothetical protein
MLTQQWVRLALWHLEAEEAEKSETAAAWLL